MTLTKTCTAIALTVVLAGCGSGDDDESAPPVTATADATTTTVAASDVLAVTVNAEGPLPSFQVPICDPSGTPCVFPASGSQTWSGDLEGSIVTATAAVADASGVRFAASRIDVFTGTVKGCGTGSFVLRSTELVHATEGEGRGEIAAGFGTGDLAQLTGTFEGEGGVVEEGIRVTWRGQLRCDGTPD